MALDHAAATGAAPEVPPPSRGLRHAFRALRHRDFALFLSGAFISSTGMWMQNVTVPYVLNEATGSATWVGLAGFAQFIPAMVMGPVGGTFADRFPRRKILLVSQSVAMVIAFVLWHTVRDGEVDPGLMVALVAVGGIASGFGIPAWQSYVPQLVPREALLNAVALNSAQFNASRALGFLVGGISLRAFGPEAAFLANALSYLAVLGALLVVRAGRTREAAGLDHQDGRGFLAALAYARGHPGILLTIVTVAVVAFLGSPVVLLAPVFAREVFHVDEAAYGYLAAAFGIGATVGAVVLGAYGDGLRRSRLTTVAIAIYGLALVGMGLTPFYAGGLVAMFVIGAGYLVVVSALNTALQESVEPRFRGRVVALYFMAFTGGYPIGALLQGWLADLVGVRLVVAGAGLVLAGYAALLVLRPAVARSLDPAPTRR
ncbi:MAG: MFS transporter [Actinomycetota bacterium]|nr:MFS transporter [Actinomycetota bacterium]